VKIFFILLFVIICYARADYTINFSTDSITSTAPSYPGSVTDALENINSVITSINNNYILWQENNNKISQKDPNDYLVIDNGQSLEVTGPTTLSGGLEMGADLDMNGFSIVNVEDSSMTFSDGSKITSAIFETDGKVLSSSISDVSVFNNNFVSDSLDQIGDNFMGTVYYVDGSRTDSYTEKGTQFFPFKTMQGCINAITDASDSKRYLCYAVNGGKYTEQVTMKNAVYLKSDKLSFIEYTGGSALIVGTSVITRIEGFFIKSISDTETHAAIDAAGGSITVRDCFVNGSSQTSGITGARGAYAHGGNIYFFNSSVQGYNRALYVSSGIVQAEVSVFVGYAGDVERTGGTLKMGFNTFGLIAGGPAITGTYTNMYNIGQIGGGTLNGSISVTGSYSGQGTGLLNVNAALLGGDSLTDVENTMDSKITTHTSNASAHHVRYADSEALAAVAAVGYFKADGSVLATGDFDLGGYSISNVNNSSITFADGSKVTSSTFETDGKILSSSITNDSVVVGTTATNVQENLMAADATPASLEIPLLNTAKITKHAKYERNSSVFTDSLGVTWLWYVRSKSYESRTQGDVDSIYYDVYYQKSLDGGATWQAPTLFPEALPVTFSPRQISFMQDGAGLHHLFIASGVSGSPSEDRLLHHFTWSGSAWTNVGPVTISGWASDPAQVGHVNVIFANSKFHMAFTARSVNSVYYTSSLDGDSWTAYKTIHATTYLLPKIVYDSGNLYVVSTKGSAISLAVSNDEFVSHTKADVITHAGSYDPSIVMFDGHMRIISAPNIGADGQQLRMYTHNSGDILTPSNWSSAEVLTVGHTDGYEYWDYWPAPVVSGKYLFIYYTSEKDPMGRAWQPGNIYAYKYGEKVRVPLGVLSDADADALPRLPHIHTYFSSNDGKERLCIGSGVPNTWKILGGTPETIYGESAGKFYADGVNNNCTVSSNVYDGTDKTHHARIAFDEDYQDYDTVFVFALSQKFTAFENSNTITFQGKCDDGSSDGINEFQLMSLQDSADIAHDLSTLNIKSSSSSLTTLSLTKTQIDALGGTFTAGGLFRIFIKSYGNLGDKCYINEDGAKTIVTY